MKKNFSKATNYEIYAIVNRVLAIEIASAELKAASAPFITALQNSFTPYQAVISKTTFSGLGTEVQQSDSMRDNLFIGLRDTLKAYIKLNRGAAAELYAIIQKYGLNLHREKLNIQTGKMQELIKEFALPAHAATLETLGLQADVEKMKTAQSNFETLVAQQSSINADLRELEAATHLRPALSAALSNYCTFLTAIKSTSPQWNALYNDVKENTRIIKISKSDKTASPAP